MAEPETIFESIVEHFETAHALDGKRAIVTTGGTIERIDTVRYISNFSSGKQGKAMEPCRGGVDDLKKVSDASRKGDMKATAARVSNIKTTARTQWKAF